MYNIFAPVAAGALEGAAQMDLRKLVRPNVRGLRAYEARETPCCVKLDANESPIGPALMKGMDLNRYPDPESKALRRELAKSMSLAPENILTGNGSDELIYYLITTFGGPVLFPTPTFVMYGIIAQALGQRPIAVPLNAEFDLDTDSMLRVVRRERPKLVFIATPNNPTGNCMSAEAILRIVETAKNTIVVVDEAYQPFASERGFAPLLGDYPNMVIMRTLSKIGLAALRVGYLAGDPALIGEVNKVRLPFNLNTCSQSLAVRALKDKKTMRSIVRSVVKERVALMDALEGTAGVEPYPSEANFILFKVASPASVQKGLLKRGVLVRNIDAVVPGCLRVTVGTQAENRAFIRALKDTLKKG